MGQYSSAKVHKLIRIMPEEDDPKELEDYKIEIDTLPGLVLEEIEGI